MVYAQIDRIAPLKSEHKGVTRQLALVRRAMVEPPYPSTRRLRESIRRLKSLLDAHFDHEESSLYRPLSLRMGKDAPVDSMTREHRSMLRALTRLSSMVEAKSSRSGLEDLRTCLDSLQRDLEWHMEREERVLFWIADLRL